MCPEYITASWIRTRKECCDRRMAKSTTKLCCWKTISQEYGIPPLSVNGQSNVRDFILPQYFPFSGFVRSPCGICPVIQDCGESGLINPSSCQYFKDWLDFWSSRINPYSCQYFKDWWDFWSSKINPSRCQYFKDCMVRFLII